MCEQFSENQSFSLFFKHFCDVYWAIHLIQCSNRSGEFPRVIRVYSESQQGVVCISEEKDRRG